LDADLNCRWLVLVPTEFELSKMRPHLPFASTEEGVCVELCGFGPIAAAARTSQLIAASRPQNVLLVGIAGSYSDQLPIGSAIHFTQVGCYGVGVGHGEHFQSADCMGWPQFSCGDQTIGDRIGLTAFGHDNHSLLTCTSASQNQDDVRLRMSTMPAAIAEDMEGFGMAMACELSGVTRRFIVRGISNRSGDRNRKNWQIDKALQSACQLAQQLIATSHE
jgi:futalosine hydrolase